MPLHRQRKEPDALQYDWFLNEDQTECIVRETYANSEALLAHLGNVGGALSKLLSMADFSVEIYGKPSEALLNAIAGIKREVYYHHQGLVTTEALV